MTFPKGIILNTPFAFSEGANFQKNIMKATPILLYINFLKYLINEIIEN